MSPTLVQIIVLAVVQGAAELLPVSSSAHVIVAEKLMRLEPASPEMMFLMIMLHTGTMVAVIAYFWKSWARGFFAGAEAAGRSAARIALATAVTGAVALVLKEIIEKVVLKGRPGAAVEDLASNLPLMAACLAAAGAVIVAAGLRSRGAAGPAGPGSADVGVRPAAVIGAVHGFSLPFRGLSRSGVTISTGMLLGVPRRLSEEFSFALGVVITPPIIAREFQRFYRFRAAGGVPVHVASLVTPGLIGMAFSFIAGLAALRWLSGWLEAGRWHYFGYYCFAAAAAVCVLAGIGY